jgi:PiT family inorganic phosphate transporter
METVFIPFLFGAAAFLITKLATWRMTSSRENLQTARTDFAAHLLAAKMQLEDARLHSLSSPAKEAVCKELEGTIAALENPESYAQAGTDFVRIEKIFAWLQVFSACLMAFAHGANDVANAIGPLSAAIYILQTGLVPLHTAVPSWALGLGGFGIVVGLATWGWRVIETIGKKLTELTPSRGFSAEFGAATTILIASRLGMPISTTHTLVGAVIGVGMARGIEALNLGLMRDIVSSWLITLPAGAAATTLIYYCLAQLLL